MASIAQRVARLKGEGGLVLSPAMVTQAAEASGHRWRDRLLDPATTLRLFMLQILHGNVACRAVRHLSGLRFSVTAYVNARHRLPLAMFTQLARALAGMAGAPDASAGLWHGHRVMLIDGTGLSMPDTPELQQHFGQPGRVQPGCGFPVMHVLWLFEAATGMIVDLVPNRWNTHDMADAAQLHPAMGQGDVLVGDRGFCSYAHIALLLSRGMHGVIRMHQRQIVDFRTNRRCRQQMPKARRKGRPTSVYERRLGRCDQVVRWVKPSSCPDWMDRADYAALPDQLSVRELRYTMPARAGFRTKRVTLVTTLLDAELYPKGELSELYQSRWQIEVNLRHVKQAMAMNVLRCKKVDGVLKELWMATLVYNVVRLSMLEAARRQGKPVDRMSFIDALDALRYRPPDAEPTDLITNPNRPGRHQPRCIKRPKDTYTYLTRPRETYSLC